MKILFLPLQNLVELKEKLKSCAPMRYLLPVSLPPVLCINRRIDIINSSFIARQLCFKAIHSPIRLE